MAMAAMDKPKKIRKDLTFENIDNGTIRLRSKPSAKMAYSFIPAHDHPASISAPGQLGGEPLLIFLSGLDNPKAVWQKTLDRLFESACAIGAELPPMLFYDRFGVGGSDPEPTDVGKPPEEFHDCADAVADLHQLLVQTMELKFNWSRSVDADAQQPLPRIVFCAHSFGACVARMFAAAYPGIVQGVLIIDSAIAQYRAEDMYPDPDVPESWAQRHDGKSMWSKGGWPDESVISKEMCRDAIKKTRASPISGHPLTTRERMRWDHMPQQLPDNKGPKLRGPTEHLPLVTVMISDPDVSGPKQSQVGVNNLADRITVLANKVASCFVYPKCFAGLVSSLTVWLFMQASHTFNHMEKARVQFSCTKPDTWSIWTPQNLLHGSY